MREIYFRYPTTNETVINFLRELAAKNPQISKASNVYSVKGFGVWGREDFLNTAGTYVNESVVDREGKLVTFEKMVELLSAREEKVKLDNGFEAIVSHDGITINGLDKVKTLVLSFADAHALSAAVVRVQQPEI